jgi:Tfp pilus assembly protein PilO
VFFAVYVFTPQLTGFLETRRDIRGLERELAAAGEVLAAEAVHRAALEKTEAELGRLRGRFSADVTDGKMMAEIGFKAAAAGVDVVNFQPREVLQSEHLRQFPVEIGVRGRFSEVATFMELLRSLSNPAEIREFAIRGEREPEHGRVWADFLLVLYSENNPARAAKGPDGLLSGEVLYSENNPARAGDFGAGESVPRHNPFEPSVLAADADHGPQEPFAVNRPPFALPETGVK